MRAYYGAKLSPNMAVTPEGFLICLNVPIARTGVQTYLRYELGYEDDPNEMVDVIRTEEEVFATATIASFEGKPVCDDHPPVEVTPDNIGAYDKGHVQNVRRGVGDESDLLIADLYITSPPLIEAIRSGRLREVSCGYDCEYKQDEQGRLYQCGIHGNHVAVVSAGRAGPRVAIKDSEQEPITTTPVERGKKNMAKKTSTNSLMARLFSRAVKDMEPDEVADAIEEMTAASDTEPEAAPAASDNEPAPATDGDVMQQVLTALTAIASKLDAMTGTPSGDEEPEAQPSADEESNSLDALEQELDEEAETPADQEAAETVPADELPEETNDEDGPEAAASSLPENPIPGADRAMAMAALRAIKPVIASLPEKQRKAASDKAAAEIRKMIGKDRKARTNGYGAINQIMRQRAKAKSKDSRPKADNGEMGQRIMANRNPHYKKQA